MSLLQNRGRIEICGGIASGKTTLTNLLAEQGFKGLHLDFTANPFYDKFFTRCPHAALATEITFLLQYVDLIQNLQEDPGIVVCDTSVVLHLAYASTNLDGTERQTYFRVYDEIRKYLDWPKLVVLLTCGEDEQLRRIRNRARTQEKDISIEYLQTINQGIERMLKMTANNFKTLELDTRALDFVTDTEDVASVIRAIEETLRNS